MRALKIVLFVLALIPIATGALDIALGLEAPRLLGAALSPEDLRDPVLDSEIRFFGAFWFGVGPLILLCLSDLRRYAVVLRGVLALVFLAGVGRTLSMAHFGLPQSAIGTIFIVCATLSQVVGMPLLLIWLFRLGRATVADADLAESRASRHGP
jgi:hypothetical protein